MLQSLQLKTEIQKLMSKHPCSENVIKAFSFKLAVIFEDQNQLTSLLPNPKKTFEPNLKTLSLKRPSDMMSTRTGPDNRKILAATAVTGAEA